VLQLLASCLPTDKRVLAKMKELTQAGVRRVPEMQLLIRDFVCNVLFAGQSEPPRFDSRFWPSDKTVRNCIYSTRMKAKYVAELQFRHRTHCNTCFAMLSSLPRVCPSQFHFCFAAGLQPAELIVWVIGVCLCGCRQTFFQIANRYS